MLAAFKNFSHLGSLYYPEESGPSPPPTPTYYVAEDGSTNYVTEDGSTDYVTENSI